MAKRPNWTTVIRRITTVQKRTSIGRSKNSRPKNKHKKRNWKRYRGQGK